MKVVVRTASIGLALLATAVPGLAAEPSDPDWPCIQRQVAHLSLGVMWPHLVPENDEPLPDDLQDVAAQLALRRVTEDQAQELVGEVATTHPHMGVEDYGRLFQATFEHIDRQRSDIMEGIGRYSRNQARLAAEIEDLQAEMAQLEDAEEPDFDRMDQIEQETDWRIRTFNDRNRALTYVCETPVLMEQRAYAIAQIILKALP